MELSPENPFERALIDIVETNRRKAHDYTRSGSSLFDNFDRVEAMTSYGFNSSVDTLISTKMARLSALRSREDPPLNESVEDTRLDLAVYAIIQYARFKYPNGKVTE